MSNLKILHSLVVIWPLLGAYYLREGTAAVTWLKYCPYGVKLYPINQSIEKGRIFILRDLSWHGAFGFSFSFKGPLHLVALYNKQRELRTYSNSNLRMEPYDE